MQYIQEFTAYLITRRRAASTIKLQVGHVRRFAREYPDPFTVTPQQLERYVAIHGVEWQARTVNSFICSLRSFYRWALRFGYIDANPTILLENVPLPNRMGRIIADATVIDALPNCTTEERAILLLGRMAGLRRSEIAAVHSRDRDGDWLTVTGKGGKTRILYLQPALAAVLDQLEAEHDADDYYLPGRFGGHRSPESVYAVIKRLTHSNPHSLRHGAATAVYRGTGGDIRATQVFLGHASIETTMRYVHVHESALIRAAEAADLHELAA